MAEAIFGRHVQLVCGNCGYTYVCGVDGPAVPFRAACPNCGHVAAIADSQPVVNADRVLIDRIAFMWRAPRRWETVAFERAEDDRVYLKRVVGLPGESIGIRDGDVYANGRIQHKNLLEQRAMAMLVHDADFTPQDARQPSRWRADRENSRWNGVGGHFTHSAASDLPGVDWLVYHHEPSGTVSDPRNAENPSADAITDVCGYNASQPRREEDVQRVTDLMLSFRIGRLAEGGTLHVRIGDGVGNDFEARFQVNADGQFLQVFHGKRIGISREIRLPRQSDCQIEVSLMDQQFLLAIDGKTVVALPYERQEQRGERTPRRSASAAIGATSLETTVWQLRLYRDVYYTHPIGLPNGSNGNRLANLASTEYYVLGDNSPVSEDSRTWALPGTVDSRYFLGRPLVRIPSLAVSLVRRRHFQVPNLAEIRYIR